MGPQIPLDEGGEYERLVNHALCSCTELMHQTDHFSTRVSAKCVVGNNPNKLCLDFAHCSACKNKKPALIQKKLLMDVKQAKHSMVIRFQSIS